MSIGLYCSNHKLDGMVDVKHKRCVHEGCDKVTPAFNVPGSSIGLYCAIHKLDGMIFKPTTKCSHTKCKSPALFGVCRPERCEEHKEPFHLNLVERRCISCGLLYILNKKGLCGICNPDEFNKTRLAKQNQIKTHYETHKKIDLN